MNIRLVRRFSLTVIALAFCMGMGGGQGCQGTGPAPIPDPLEGLWTLTRGQLSLDITWNTNGGGMTHSDSSSGNLQTLDPADYPPALTDLVNQWNDGINDLNAKLDEAFPEHVVVSFPQYGIIELVNADEPANTGLGAINSANEYFFIGDLAGTASSGDQGAGGVLTAATIQGSFDEAALTTQGQVARTLLIFLASPTQNSASFTAQIKVDYTGSRTGDTPADIQSQLAAEQMMVP